MAKVAVVILNYNGRQYLEKFLPDVIRHSSDSDIYVADNKSSDTSISFLKEHFPEINLILLETNNGYAAGYNLALKQVEAEYYILLNSDIEVTANWINPIVDFMDSHPNVAACQPKILDYKNKEYFEYAGAAGGYLDILGYPYCRGRIFDTLEKDHGQYDSNQQVFWATGACMFIRSEVFHQLGGFDESFFAHMEEIDLCWRINMSGKQVYCIPESKVFHVGGGTLAKSNPQKTYLNFRNNLTMLYKNSTGISLFWKLPLKFLLDILASLKFWKDNSFDHFTAVFKAYSFFVKKIPENNLTRLNLKKNNLSTPLSNSLTPVQYYLFGKKHFSDLTKQHE
ncbi:glycosyltransferase family 2 protein [Reichenbachiella sp. MALMAid0571]|uniref:glycosyltransferase family 2 protein n=1 Tax=Reichenbachiella sp. MALMAid0571 TaxID=3143939 RepID=UPI0032DE5A35